MSSKKILINKNDAGFGLSKEAHELFLKKANIPFTKKIENFKTIFIKSSELNYEAALMNAKDGKELTKVKDTYLHHCSEIPRDHPALLEVADFLGLDAMNDRFSKLEFVDVPEDKQWSIKEINGVEYLAINPNPIPKFKGISEHWYDLVNRRPWMDDEKDLVVMAGRDKNGNIVTKIVAWKVLQENAENLIDVKWYPLTKLCPLYNAN